MQITRNKLLVTLVIVSVALLLLSSASSAAPRFGFDRAGTTSSVSKGGVSTFSGEPDGNGGGAPLPTIPQTKYSVIGARHEAPGVSARGIAAWWTLIGRIWVVRYWGVTY